MGGPAVSVPFVTLTARPQPQPARPVTYAPVRAWSGPRARSAGVALCAPATPRPTEWRRAPALSTRGSVEPAQGSQPPPAISRAAPVGKRRVPRTRTGRSAASAALAPRGLLRRPQVATVTRVLAGPSHSCGVGAVVRCRPVPASSAICRSAQGPRCHTTATVLLRVRGQTQSILSVRLRVTLGQNRRRARLGHV
eukprot:scaffold266_cov391-Prasinococcus_capsulatus_cf.AAC.15